MPTECLHILARNRPRVMAEITTLLAHRHPRVISLHFACSDPARMHAQVFIEVGDRGESELLRRRLQRIVEIIDVVAVPTVDAT